MLHCLRPPWFLDNRFCALNSISVLASLVCPQQDGGSITWPPCCAHAARASFCHVSHPSHCYRGARRHLHDETHFHEILRSSCSSTSFMVLRSSLVVAPLTCTGSAPRACYEPQACCSRVAKGPTRSGEGVVARVGVVVHTQGPGSNTLCEMFC